MKSHLTMLGLMILSLGCSDSSMPTQTQLDSSINGKTIKYPINYTFSLELDLNASAGYQWDHNISDTTIVHLDSTKTRPKYIPIVPGGETVKTFYFRTMKTGICTLNLIEHQRWLPDVLPIHSIQFIVFVYH